MYQNDDLRIENIQQLLPPVALLEKYPASEISSQNRRVYP
jgi:3-deoxy-7-phosphoheptulonate synthase